MVPQEQIMNEMHAFVTRLQGEDNINQYTRDQIIILAIHYNWLTPKITAFAEERE